MRILALALLLFSALRGADESLVTFTSTTQLVIETVAVTDSSGKAITGLKPEDFTVTEDGVAQKISLFEFQQFDDTPAAQLTRRDAPVAEPAPSQPAAAAPAVPRETRYKDNRLIVLYFDMSAMQQADAYRALDAARKFLKSGMTVADRVAIMRYSGGSLKLMQDFTEDTFSLGLAIAKLEASLSKDGDDVSEVEGSAFGQEADEFNLFHTDRQLAALQTAVQNLARLKEKKALIYFSSGMQLNGVDNQAQLRSTLNSAIRAGVSFFTVDARGLTALPPMGDASRGSSGGLSVYTGQSQASLTSAFDKSQDTLYALAADTGGKALLDQNDLALGITAAQKAWPSYYLIGYYTTNSALDGKFRKVSVTLKEIAGKLDYRRGYFAGKQFTKFTTADKERQLEEALMLEDPVTDITISMEINYFQLNRAEYYVPVMLKMPGNELVLARRGGAERTVIDFIGEVKDEAGVTVQNIRDKVELKISEGTVAELAAKAIQYDTGFSLLPGRYTMKVLARENETGRVGTYLHTFTIPNLNKETARIPISSVVLSGQRISMKDAIYTVGKDKEQVANPLVVDGMKLIPSVTRVFSRARDLFVYLQAYEPSAEKTEPLLAYVTFYRAGSKAFETRTMRVTEALPGKLRPLPMRFNLSLADLKPGRYECQVTVLSAAGGKAAFWRAPVMVTQ
jgi:VWFA-related protein